MTRADISIFHGPGKAFEFTRHSFPTELAEWECLIQVLLATICGSDLHTHAGKRQEPVPLILGHEGVGRVIATGTGRDKALIGQRVSWTLADNCGTCKPCGEWGLPQKCEHLFKYGHASMQDGAGLNGTYATHLVLRGGTTIVPIPDSVTNEMAAPANCAIATMMAATELMADGGGTAVIQGAGLLGLFGCFILKQAGWNRVVVVDTKPHRLELVSEFGGEPASNSALSLVGAAGADAVIEAAGNPYVITEGIGLLRPGGRYEWLGMVHPGSNVDLSAEMVIRKCLTIRGTHNYAPRHLLQAMKLLEGPAQALPWDRIVSPALPLREMDKAFALAASGQWPRVAVATAEG